MHWSNEHETYEEIPSTSYIVERSSKGLHSGIIKSIMGKGVLMHSNAPNYEINGSSLTNIS